jgi:hypothetical protein
MNVRCRRRCHQTAEIHLNSHRVQDGRQALKEGGYETATAPSAEEGVTLLQGKGAELSGIGHGYQFERPHDGLGRGTEGPRVTSRISHRLHDRWRGRGLGVARRPQQHLAGQTVRSGAACHGSLSTAQQRLANNAVVIVSDCARHNYDYLCNQRSRASVARPHRSRRGVFR